MSNVATINTGTAVAMSDDELIGVLQNSLYPGASINSVRLVLGYCNAARLDPMQKPVHIVPMWDKNSKSTRDVVMPGIGLYRTQAARSGQYAGVTEPEFGEDINEDVGGVRMTYPKWCKVTVKRQLDNGAVVEFTASEFWKENYATAGKDSEAPNAMWKKRPYAQLAKCAEAQALRKAFPEVGSAPTADEMEGKEVEYEGSSTDGNGKKAEQKAEALPAYPAEQMKANKPTWVAAIKAGTNTPAGIIAKISSRYTLDEGQKREILNLGAIEGEAEIMAKPEDIAAMRERAEAATISEAAILKHLNVESFDNLTMKQLDQADAYINNPV